MRCWFLTRRDEIREVVAAAVGAPHRVLISASDFPGHLVATRGLLHADRRPNAKLASHNGSAAISQQRAGAAAVKVEVIANARKAGRSKRLDRRRRDAECAVAVVAIFADYAAKSTSAPMRIPTLDGAFIWSQHPQLFKYNLAYYRPFFQGFDQRLTLLRNSTMGELATWVINGVQTVPSLRQAADPGFVRTLETNHDLQSLYLGSIDLEPLPKARLDGEPMHFDAVEVSNTTSLTRSRDSLSFSTAGGAPIILFPESWDPEQAHILTLRVNAAPDKPIPGEETRIEVVFDGQLRIPYAAK
jgi:hypothetical protein